MIISLSGFGNSGSSAVLDYLKGYSDLFIFDDFEFQLLHQTDGILDLKYYLTSNQERISCHSAITRFIRSQKYGAFSKRIRKIIGKKYDKWVCDYLNNIVQVSWKGEFSVFDPQDVSLQPKCPAINIFNRTINVILRHLNSKWHFPAYKERFFSLIDENLFDSITREYLKKLFELIQINLKEDVVVDMLFSTTNPNKGMEFFDSPKCIVVVRDPRDLFFSSKYHPDHSRFMPTDDVKKYCEFYKTIRKTIEKNMNTRTILIQYEDLIYDYDKTTKKLRKIINKENKPDREFAFFDPSFSVRYTNLIDAYKKYPDEYQIIAEQLSEYFYNYGEKLSPLKDEELLLKIKNSNNSYVGLQDKN